MQPDEAVRTQVLEVLERFNELVSTKDQRVLEEFAAGDDVLLIGSEIGEVAAGSQEIASFFTRIFARDVSFSWEWDHIYVSCSHKVAWFFADGRVVLSTVEDQRMSPYRITGVLERQGERWLWKQYHGSEPVESG